MTTAECWAEEGGIRVRVLTDPEDKDPGRRVVEIVDVTTGWPGTVIARVTLASFRARDIAAALTPNPRTPDPVTPEIRP